MCGKDVPMMWRWFLVGGVLLVGGCSSTPTCEDTCERQLQCAMPDDDCVAGCEEGKQRAEAADCPDTHADLQDCLDTSDDACSTSGCEAETAAFFACTCPNGSCLE